MVNKIDIETTLGTGKTSLAEAAAREASADFFCIRPSDILSKYQGESERFLRNLFEMARKRSRAVIFFDGINFIQLIKL
jgi:vacuolar protein-sorting-associated protein 4